MDKITEIRNNTETVENLTKEIEYITSNSNGDIFKIIALFGKTNINNTNILDLDQVDGTISSIQRSEIYIESDLTKNIKIERRITTISRETSVL